MVHLEAYCGGRVPIKFLYVTTVTTLHYIQVCRSTCFIVFTRFITYTARSRTICFTNGRGVFILAVYD
ncbi:unnamed protein product [Tenebrio molitor]|nr:unnamed protein product [Tenebrio molitor]